MAKSKKKKKKSTAKKMKRIMKNIRTLNKKWHAATTRQDITIDKKKSARYGRQAKKINKRMDKLQAQLDYLRKK